jgi:Domain of unknown function (DUF5658)
MPEPLNHPPTDADYVSMAAMIVGARGPKDLLSGTNRELWLIAWGGASVALLDGLTTFIGLRNGKGEENAFQALAIHRYGLGLFIVVRVLGGIAMFVLVAALVRRWSGWRRRVLFALAAATVAATGVFVLNNASVLFFRQRIVPPSYVHVVDVHVGRLAGLVSRR